MFGRKSSAYDGCEKACSAPSYGAYGYDLAQAIRQVANQPEPAPGPRQILLAEDGSIVNERDVPANVTVVYYKPGAHAPQLLTVGY
jgi:hypothetical protein